MKAAIWRAYGPPDTLELEEIDTPVPKAGQVLIKIVVTTVTLGDCEIRGSYLPLWTRIPLKLLFGVFKPRGRKILGQECAGEIVGVGEDVSKFAVGDRVVAQPGIGMGTYAQYRVMNEQPGMGMLVKIPPDLSYEAATTLPIGGLNAMYFLKLADLKPGEEILINGAGGSIGTYAVAIARHWGANIMVVDLKEKFAMLRELGAESCIDFTEEDFTHSDRKYDVIFDIVGKVPFRRVGNSLKSGGRYLTANPKPNTMIRSKIQSMLSDKQYYSTVMSERKSDLEELMELITQGMLSPVIDRRFPLDEIVEAHRYVETGRKQGHVIITMD